MKPNAPVCGLLAASLPALLLSASMAGPVHVSPAGDDSGPGTAQRPLATLQKAIDAVAGLDGAQEIILAPGVYRGAIVPPRENPPPLVIRAARKPNGEFEDVILDGSDRIAAPQPLPNAKHTYRIPFKRVPAFTYSVWEEATRVRYRVAASADAVAQAPASYFVDSDALLFRVSGDKLPSAYRIGVARDNYGLLINRAKVTVQGLQFRHYMLQRSSAGVRTNAAHTIIEDCRVWNARRGVTIGAGLEGVRVSRLRADDVGNGVFTYGVNAIVEDCVLLRARGRFEVPEYSQDQSGIQAYHPSAGAECRRNLVVGFNLGLFFKCQPSRFIAESNTVIGASDAQFGIGCTQWHKDSIFRWNVVAGFNNAVLYGEDGIPQGAVVDQNLIWQPEGGDGLLKRIAGWGAGASNVNADPMFVNAEEWDFRLSPNSPAAKTGPNGGPAGALGVADGNPGRLLAPVAGAVLEGDVPTEAAAQPQPRIAPAFVKRAGPPRVLAVCPAKGRDDPAGGAESAPLKSLQFALNHANPGDRVLLLPGVHFGPCFLNHGGTKEAPIVIEGSPQGGAVIDGMKLHDDANLALEDAPHVIIRNIEIRWFKEAGLSVKKSPDVRVERCVFWNNDWSSGRRIGIGMVVMDSPRFVVDHCLLYAMNDGFSIWRSPGFRITHVTCAMMLHRAARLIDTVAHSVFMNNSFTFTGNDHLAIRATPEEMKTFQCDYNNLAMYVRSIAPSRPAPDEDIKPDPSDFFRTRESKAVMSLNGERYYSLREWREKTGKDMNSIYKHPRYADPQNRDFRLLPDSPNIGAGKDGATLGALGVKEP